MNFTREDIYKIQRALLGLGIKDSEMPEAYTPLSTNDTISIVQGGLNKKINIQDFISQLGFLHNEDFINITDKYDESYITLSEAIRILPEEKRKRGLIITFQDTNGDWRMYQFRGDISQFNNETLWKDLYDFTEYIVNSILPDEEDITKVSIDSKGNYVTKIKDKKYDPKNFSGMATKILRKRIVEIDDPELGKVKKNILYQDDFDQENCIYEIRYNFDLNGEAIIIPNNCIINYKGGSISNGIINNCGGYIGIRSNALIKGTIEQRPVLDTEDGGYQYYDTNLHIPIWWNGTQWIDGTNTPV